MSKYQEALDRTKEAYKAICDEININELTIKMNEDVEVLQELIDKETPKKPILVSDYDGLVYECPVCHNEFRPDTILNHVKYGGCPYCLQKITFRSDEDA